MSDQEKVDMDKPRKFSGPNDGELAAAVRIPEAIRKIAIDLNGKTMSLKEAVALLKAADIGKIWVVSEYGYIGLNISRQGCQHHFRVIRYV